MKLKRGIKLLEQREGIGDPAKKGDRILYNLKMFLHRGEEVPLKMNGKWNTSRWR
jgi:hypothetical protein